MCRMLFIVIDYIIAAVNIIPRKVPEWQDWGKKMIMIPPTKYNYLGKNVYKQIIEYSLKCRSKY